jgi:hypothetical protein
MQESNPAKYHDAWRIVVGAGYVYIVPSLKFRIYPRKVVYLFLEDLVNEELKA